MRTLVLVPTVPMAIVSADLLLGPTVGLTTFVVVTATAVISQI